MIVVRNRMGVAFAGLAMVGGGLMLAAPSSLGSVPAGMSEIASRIDELPANCRRIAERRLKAALDRAEEPILTHAGVDRVISPLKRGGASLCNDITGQSFLLGGV